MTTANPFLKKSQAPVLPALLSSSPVSDTLHNQPTAVSATQLAYLAQLVSEGEIRWDRAAAGQIQEIFQGTKDSENNFAVSLRPAAPCWRFADGYAAYFGPVPTYAPIHGEGYALGPASVAIDPEAPCATWGQPEIAGDWERWSPEEQQLYTDVRAESLRVVGEWYEREKETLGGTRDSLLESIDIRLACARYAAVAVHRFREWRYNVLNGRKGGKS